MADPVIGVFIAGWTQSGWLLVTGILFFAENGPAWHGSPAPCLEISADQTWRRLPSLRFRETFEHWQRRNDRITIIHRPKFSRTRCSDSHC
jgi:hypothetical protein